MKTNEVPEKIYIDDPTGEFDDHWSMYQNNDSIEYIRKDVFIEKVCKFLNKEIPITDLSSSNMLDIEFKVFDKETKRCLIEQFKNYMKGE